MKTTSEDGILLLHLEGRIDSTNAAAVEQELNEALSEHPGTEFALDAEALDYISSAGLRVLLRLRQSVGKEITVRNASPAVYEIFDVTGFTSLLKVEKAFRFFSVQGLEQLGAGAHSAVYRLDEETILKVVKDMTLEAIRAEMQVSKDVLIRGVPTAISYDVVRTDEGYGEVYEMFRAGVVAAAVMAEPERRTEYLRRFVDMYRHIHSVEIGEGELNSARERYLAAADAIAPYVTQDELAKIRKMILAIPERHTFVHGDFHMNNVMLHDGELVLIDMGEASYGHPLFDFAQTAWAYELVNGNDPARCRKVLGMTVDEAQYVHDNLFRMYFDDTGEALERKLTVVDGMGQLRRVLIPFLQGWSEPATAVRERLKVVRENLFPRIDEICELIASEF